MGKSMVAYKNQHYLPEFYFRFFSKDHESIEIYDINSGAIKRKGYKKLCSESYFYSKIPDFEKSIHDLENSCREVLLKLMDREKLNLNEYFSLLYFISFQISRTKKEKIFYENIFDKFAKSKIKELYYEGKLFQEGHVEVFNQLDDFIFNAEGIGSSSIAHMSFMYLSLQSAILLADLKPLLLINETSNDFIFSDNPIIIYNKYFYNKKRHFATGFASHGLQIFCPLRPKIILVLYDDNFYSFKGENKREISIKTESDVNSLNSLQFFNCYQNIFFSDISQRSYVLELHQKLKRNLNHKQDEYDWYLIPTSSLNLKISDVSNNGHAEERWITVPNSNAETCLSVRGPNRNIIDYDLELSIMSLNTSASWEGPSRNPMLCKEYESHIEKQMSKFMEDSKGSC